MHHGIDIRDTAIRGIPAKQPDDLVVLIIQDSVISTRFGEMLNAGIDVERIGLAALLLKPDNVSDLFLGMIEHGDDVVF
ncbi:hypothetical protein D3C86_1986210 [compost metagenome]